MRYSLSFKQSILRRVLPPNNGKVISVAKEAGISETTIYLWLKKARNNRLDKDYDGGPNSRSVEEKLNLLLESKTVDKEKQGHWLREKALHSEHLKPYEQELTRKEKALAEMAALLTLNKNWMPSSGRKRKTGP